MESGEWLLVLVPDGTVLAAQGGAPPHWVGRALGEQPDAPEALRRAAREVTARLRHPSHAGGPAWTRVAPVDGAAAAQLVAVEAIPVRREPVALAPLLESALAVVRRQAEALEVAFTIECDPGLPARVSVDAEKLAWCMTAVAGNALRHVRRGTRSLPGGSIRVRATPDPAADTVSIAVSDDGPGMPPGRLAALFDRAPDAAHAPALGLALVREVVVAHGGSLAVTSSTEAAAHGTTVVLTLPVL